MSIAKIQRGDKVKVITGSFKGTVGTVTKVIKTSKGKKAAVKGVPMIAKFKKSFTYDGQSYPGSISYVDRFIDISNLAVVDDKGDISKVGIKFEGKKRVRYYKTTGKTFLSNPKLLVEKEEKKETEKKDN
jgi:large subunit ribosomal protein L24